MEKQMISEIGCDSIYPSSVIGHLSSSLPYGSDDTPITRGVLMADIGEAGFGQ